MGFGPGEDSLEAHEVVLAAYGVGSKPRAGSRRDTTMLYRYVNQTTPAVGATDGWRVWRIRVTQANVGIWMMDRHTLQRILIGRQTV
jgi:hypothetical protein